MQEMERLGILLDLAHVSVKSFHDALAYYKKPILVSHSNAYALCPSRRNLNDEQLKALHEHGGLVGITQVADFVHEDNPSLETMIDHMVYIAELIGVEYVALGSDFDGADNMVINDVSGYSSLPDIMQQRGFTDHEINMILYSKRIVHNGTSFGLKLMQKRGVLICFYDLHVHSICIRRYFSPEEIINDAVSIGLLGIA